MVTPALLSITFIYNYEKFPCLSTLYNTVESFIRSLGKQVYINAGLNW